MNDPQQILPIGKEFIYGIDDSHLRSFLLNIPKVDLHRHITGSLRFSTIHEILQNYQIELPNDRKRKIPLRDDPKHLEKQVTLSSPSQSMNEKTIERIWGILNKIVVNKEIISRITYEAIEDASKEGLIYLELRISPYGVMNGSGPQKRSFNFYDFLNSLKLGIDKAASNYPSIITKIILSLPRHYFLRRFNTKDSVKEFENLVLKPCLEFKSKYIVGFDLAGKKGGYSLSQRDYIFWPLISFHGYFQKIKEYGFKITIHAAENENAQSVEDAIEKLYADRIGHGINAQNDEKIMQILREKKIPLEICPSSNVKLRAVNSLDDHPIRKFQDHGIMTTINTDDPSVFKTDLINEYFILMRNRVLGYKINEIYLNILNSLNSAFVTDYERISLISRFNEYIKSAEVLRGDNEFEGK